MIRRFYSLLTLLCSSVIICAAQTVTDERSTPWRGFEKISFTIEGRSAWFVKPKQPAEGNPWIWRAHFPDWHTGMDSILLSRGFHVAYVNTNDLFGHPKAMQVWDTFYDYLTKEKKFAAKVALEGVSRGGLYVYGWAKRNPDKVSCVYAEAPVCDPKSWPGGKGKGPGSKKDWELWLQLYGLSEAQAADFKDIPLNDLAGLAAFKVPLIHVIGLNDKLVPSAENSDLLIQAYEKLGGPVSVFPMTRGKQELEGHHFPIEHPEQLADLIETYNRPSRKMLSQQPYIEMNGGLGNAFAKFRSEKKGTVAFLGGSITHNPGWRDKTAQYLREHFPDTKFELITAGIPSLGSTPHAYRFSRDVLAKGIPDLLFVEAAVNDRGNGFTETAQVRALEGILRQMYRANPKANVVMMAFAEPAKNKDYEEGRVPVEVEVHQRVAKHYGAVYINLAKEVYDRIKDGEFNWEYDFKDLHPSPYGQEVYFQTIKEVLKQEPATGMADLSKLPAPLDRFSYEKGSYHAVSEARNLKGFTLNPDWTPSDKLPTRPGFVHVPMLVGESTTSSFDFDFTGRAVGIAIVSGGDAGTIAYTIDGKRKSTLDLFSRWSNQLHLPWYLMLADDLKAGKHKLHLEIISAKNQASAGNAARIVYLLVNE